MFDDDIGDNDHNGKHDEEITIVTDSTNNRIQNITNDDNSDY